MQTTQTVIGAIISLLILCWNPIRTLAQVYGEKALSHLPTEAHSLIEKIVEKSVAEVEQLSQIADDAKRIPLEDRQQYAIDSAQDLLRHAGINMTDAQVRTFVEYFVSLLPPTGVSGNQNLDDPTTQPPANVVPFAAITTPQNTANAATFTAN